MATHRMTYNSAKAYTEAWIYLMQMGGGFKYCRTEQWVDPDPTDCEEEDNDTMKRLKDFVDL